MNIIYCILVGLQTLFGWLLSPFFLCRARRQEHLIPKIDNSILKYSATTLAEKIRNKEITCTEVINSYINRIKSVNPILNAVVEDRFSAALNDAKKYNQIIASNELSRDYIALKYPLLGVPLTVKESCSLEGLSYCVGSKKRIGLKAEKDGIAVRKLKEAGAIPLLVSNTPELCSGWESSNLVTGRTLNPYNTSCTSGGSSGGEGALLGSGASVIGVGSDIAGSIRVPAMFNGVFGHKPTPKIISIAGHYPISSDEKVLDFLVVGPMTRYAEDLKLMTKIMSENPENLKLDEKVNISELNVFFMYYAEKSIILTNVDKEIKTIMDKCLDYLKSDCGCNIYDHKFNMKSTCEMSATLFYKLDDIPNVLRDPVTGQVNENLYFEMVKVLFSASKYSFHGLFFYFLQKHNIFVSRSKYYHYKEKATHLKKDFIEKLGNTGVFLYPTFPIPPFKHDNIVFKTASVMYTMVFNALGLPSTNVPLGTNKEGLPIGIQVVAAPYQDRLCFTVAEELEKCFGGWIEP